MLEIADFARTQLANLLISLKRLSRMSGIADFAKHHRAHTAKISSTRTHARLYQYGLVLALLIPTDANKDV